MRGPCNFQSVLAPGREADGLIPEGPGFSFFSYNGYREIPLLESERVVTAACLGPGEQGGRCPLRVESSAGVLASVDSRIFGHLKEKATKLTHVFFW